jgi:phosphate/sulfate permease
MIAATSTIGAGIIASAKGRSGFGYFVLSLLLSPLIGFLLAVGMPSLMYVDANGVRRRVQEPKLEDTPPSPAQWAGEWWVAIIVLIVVALAALAGYLR